MVQPEWPFLSEFVLLFLNLNRLSTRFCLRCCLIHWRVCLSVSDQTLNLSSSSRQRWVEVGVPCSSVQGPLSDMFITRSTHTAHSRTHALTAHTHTYTLLICAHSNTLLICAHSFTHSCSVYIQKHTLCAYSRTRDNRSFKKRCVESNIHKNAMNEDTFFSLSLIQYPCSYSAR
jgi:hypothetical protein